MNTTTRWMGPGQELTDRHEKAAWALVEQSGGLARFDLIVLAGSLPAGLGHGHSDVDLFVVPADGRPMSERVRFIDGVPVQLNNIRREDLELLAKTFDAYTVVPEERSQLLALRPWAKLATRLAFGRLVHATAECGDLVRRCRPEVLRLLTLTDSSRMVGRLVEDAAGALLTVDPLIALHASHEALRYAAEGLLAACGDVFVSDSAHWRRLARVPGLADLVPFLWGLVTGAPAWNAGWPEVQAHVRRVVAATTHMVSRAQLDGWTTRMTRCAPPPARPAGPYYRNPFFQVLRFGDAIAIVGPDKAFRCNDATARAWLGADLDPAGVPAGGIERLHRMGLLVPSDTTDPERR